MRPAKETNWGYLREAKIEDFRARMPMLMVDVGNRFDPTINPVLLGERIVPDRKPIRRGKIFFHARSGGAQGSIGLTEAIGKSPSSFRFWIEC